MLNAQSRRAESGKDTPHAMSGSSGRRLPPKRLLQLGEQPVQTAYAPAPSSPRERLFCSSKLAALVQIEKISARKEYSSLE